jgi:hypothetical protein
MLNENLIYEAQRMLHERCVYYQRAAKKSTDKEFKIHCEFAAFAYSSACDILLAAVQGNAEILSQFDYFGEEEE